MMMEVFDVLALYRLLRTRRRRNKQKPVQL